MEWARAISEANVVSGLLAGQGILANRTVANYSNTKGNQSVAHPSLSGLTPESTPDTGSLGNHKVVSIVSAGPGAPQHPASCPADGGHLMVGEKRECCSLRVCGTVVFR